MASRDDGSLAYRGGELTFDDHALGELAGRWGTPFFLLGERRLLANYRALESGFAAAGTPARLRYCAKTNGEAAVLAALARAGAGLLASHRAELDLGLRCGFAPASIAYQRPLAPAAEIAAAIENGAGLVHAVRPEDLELLRAHAAPGQRVRVSLRLRGRAAPWDPLASLQARLGFTPAEVEAAAVRAADDRLRFVAVNVYVGTQRAASTSFDAALRDACRLAARLQARGLPLEEINLGGGIPSPSLRRLAPARLWQRWRDPTRPWLALGDAERGPRQRERFATELGRRYLELARAAGLEPLPVLAAEPGRAIVGDAMVLVSRVSAAAGRWLFVDASRNLLGESPLLFRRDILPLREPARAAPTRFRHISGDTLNTTDVLDLHRRLPPIAAGDLLAFADAGAYSLSRASRYGGLTPRVLSIGIDGSVREIRRPETVDDLAAPMHAVAAPGGPHR